MSIKSIANGYEVDCRPQGRNGKRYRKRFKTKAEAQQYERHLMATRNSKDWIDKPQDKRSLTELIELWFYHHGQYLKRGIRDRAILDMVNEEMGFPKAYQITAKRFSEYRSSALAKGNKPSTINRNANRLSSVFTALIKVDEFHAQHPLKGISRLKEKPTEMGFLSKSEIIQLLSVLKGDHLKVAKVCLSTGARWGEAEKLRGSDIVNGTVTFHDTKNGKNRSIPITPELYEEIYTGHNGRLFKNCYAAFYSMLRTQNFDLPKGQGAHVLRHTFASHFMMNGGNILTLQKILGHGTVMQTMRYSHLSPDFLSEALALNPLSTI
ncbi:tyrosine-type recombinase/integrase [Aliivibrio fischeri]|uniref:phage integrase n=1 Tax=Aliivibrio fischeri TaxID=668 RepID=UPI0007C5631B|nr:tyrosine-type recombinase/integrase [Aliivibrio fischeri]